MFLLAVLRPPLVSPLHGLLLMVVVVVLPCVPQCTPLLFLWVPRISRPVQKRGPIANFLMLMRAVGHASPEIHRRGGDLRVVFWSLEAESVCLYTEEWLLSQPCTPLSLISL